MVPPIFFMNESWYRCSRGTESLQGAINFSPLPNRGITYLVKREGEVILQFHPGRQSPPAGFLFEPLAEASAQQRKHEVQNHAQDDYQQSNERVDEVDREETQDE